MSRHDLALAHESCRGHGIFSPLLTANVCITRHELSTLCIIYSIAISLGNWFCMSRKGGTGEGGLVHLESENSMAMHRETATVMQTYTEVRLHQANGVATGLAENGSERQSVKLYISVTVFYGKP